jgi:hypothetical protein
MGSTSQILIVAGVICLSIGGFIFYKLAPKEGQPPSAWTSTDFRGTTVAMGVLVLMMAGVGMLMKGILS